MSELTVHQLSYQCFGRSVLHDIDFSLVAGQFVGLLGANGAGKTSLMRVIAGAAPHFAGSVAVAGKTTSVARKANVSASFGFDGAPALTLEKLAKLSAKLIPSFDLAKWQALATFLQLDTAALFANLSKGNQQKATLALTLSKSASVYLLDEPFDGIDAMTRKLLKTSLLQFLPEAAIVLIADHHLEDITSLIDHVLILKDGALVADQDADAARSQSGMSLEAYYESFFVKGGD